MVLIFLLQYGKDYEFEAPVKLLDKLLYSMPESPEEQLVVVSQVLYVYNLLWYGFCSYRLILTFLLNLL